MLLRHPHPSLHGLTRQKQSHHQQVLPQAQLLLSPEDEFGGTHLDGPHLQLPKVLGARITRPLDKQLEVLTDSLLA